MMTEQPEQPFDVPFDVIVSGHLCLDLLPRMEHVTTADLAQSGRLWETGPMDISTGGVVSNTGLALHQLGVRVGLMSMVGDDLIGQLILARLRQFSPTLTELVKVLPAQASSYSVVLAPERGDRTFLHCTGTNATFDYDSIDQAQLRRTTVFHLGYPPLLPRLIANDGEPLVNIYRAAKRMEAITSMDMVMPDPQKESGRADWHTILRKTLPHVDIFVPSIEETVYGLRRADFDRWGGNVFPHLNEAYLRDLTDEILGMGVAIAGLKLAQYGIYLRTGDTARIAQLSRLPLDVAAWSNVTLWHPAFQVEVVGTTGAGDSAYGGLLTGLLKGVSPATALAWACAVGACCVEAADASSGIQPLEAVIARLAAGWPVRAETPF